MTILMTQRLAELRAQARVNFPGYDFLPGDEPPVGETLERETGLDGVRDVVCLGEFKPHVPDPQKVKRLREALAVIADSFTETFDTPSDSLGALVAEVERRAQPREMTHMWLVKDRFGVTLDWPSYLRRKR